LLWVVAEIVNSSNTGGDVQGGDTRIVILSIFNTIPQAAYNDNEGGESPSLKLAQ